jgi:glucokinase
VLEDVIQLTNSAWQFSRAQLSATLGIPVFILNDFGAQAYALAELTDEQIDWWQHGAPSQTLEHAATHTRSIVGPGTGFGGASLLPSGEVLNSEPGHVSFAPVSSHEAQLLTLLWQRYPRVSVEHLLSGPGLANLYWANAALQGKTQTLDANLIVEGAKRGDALCLQVIQDFTGILGSVCGDIALSTGSLSGVFLSGAIVEKIDSLFDKGLFMTRFTDKGPFTHWCRQLPVGRFVCEYPGLMGCAAFSRELHV